MNRRECLEAATKAVCFDRNADYGDAENNLGRIADLWNHLGVRRSDDLISASDVALMMILVKVARQAHSSKTDNWIDIAGYAALGAELDANESEGC